ncbi:MAG TPA: oligopeptide/dipeptide ABC transporter ATP-binding protein [Candidatus Limnocylindria bacterium]|nr:oligopeptide/dipeptide ABC transporter ATP-binding protein [Candidatus Limnocylindria bacterium]
MTAPPQIGKQDAPILQVEHLTKQYAARHDLLGRVRSRVSAVDDVSFTMRRGETLAVVGESGSGKSTLAKLVVRLAAPTSGRMLFRGIDVGTARGEASRELHRRIQIVFQDPYSSLDPRQVVGRIIAEGLHFSGLDRAARKRRVLECMASVGLPTNMVSNYPHQLSGGQRQRVGIARVLAADADLIVADEPVSALDGSIQGQVLNLLKKLQAERGLTMLFITHDLSVARYMADRIAVMHLGRIVEFSPTERLFEQPVHPYSQALLSAVPRFGRGDGKRIILSGEAPSPIDPPPVCRFAGRCPWRTDVCVSGDPALIEEVGPDHSVACFNWRVIPADSFGHQAAG